MLRFAFGVGTRSVQFHVGGLSADVWNPRLADCGLAVSLDIFGMVDFIAKHPLNRRGQVKALGRFARWQIASRLVNRPMYLPFVDGTGLMVRRGMTGATGNWYCGLHEPDEMAFVLHALRPGDLFADIGANVGSYTVLAAGAVGANVICAEPLPDTFDHLMTNIRVNHLDALVDAHCCGISDHAGELSFTAGLDTMNRVARPDEGLPTRTVPVVTLDELCKDRCPAVMKIDVEGHELPVLDGASRVLASPELKAIVMETNGAGQRYGVSDDVIIDRLRASGFTPCRYDWQSRTVAPVARGANNTIFIRDPEAMARTCQESRRYTLVNGTI